MPRTFVPLPVSGLLLIPIVLVLLLGGCASRGTRQQEAVLYTPGELVLPDGKRISDARFVLLAKDAQYILVGERHDNARDHAVQARLIHLLAQDDGVLIVGLEMLPRNSFVPELRRFEQGELSVADLESALDWKRTWGFHYALYEPVFQALARHGVPARGLNIPATARRAVSREGVAGLSPESRQGFPREIIAPLPEQRERLGAFFAGHKDMIARARAGSRTPEPGRGVAGSSGPSQPSLVMPVVVPAKKDGRPDSVTLPVSLDRAFERFLLVQSLWDSTMAEEAVMLRGLCESQSGTPCRVLILAGSGHVEFGQGIAHRIRRFDPDATILSVMPFADQITEPRAGDVFYFSPAGGRKGYGIAFAQEATGVRVTEVVAGSPASRAGVRGGDRILRAGQHPVSALADMHRAAMAASRSGGPLRLVLERDGKQSAVVLDAPKAQE